MSVTAAIDRAGQIAKRTGIGYEKRGKRMRDYQRKKNNTYILPRAVWNQTIWAIRDYYRLKEEADSIITSSPSSDGSGSHSGPGDPTYAKAVKRERLMKRVDIIDQSLARIPQEYRKGVWENVMYGSRFPDDAHRVTYSRHKSRFVYIVAEKMGFY